MHSSIAEGIMGYLMLAIGFYFFLHMVYYVFVGALYQEYGSKIQGSKIDKFMHMYRYTLATGCILSSIFWQGVKPPTLDMSKMQVSEGIVDCVSTKGKNPTIIYKVDGQRYYEDFSYVFGVTSYAMSCDKALNGRMAKICWIEGDEKGRRLKLEIRDLQTKEQYGIGKERMMGIYQNEIENKFWFYLTKAALFILALHFIFWKRAMVYHNWIDNRIVAFLGAKHKKERE